jgi:four helix bundle protein
MFQGFKTRVARGGIVGHSYRDLVVWQKAKRLAVHVYRQTEGFPKMEIYGLTSQMRRAAISVVSNIAEGQGRLTPGELLDSLRKIKRAS